jgi:hypothetical protein
LQISAFRPILAPLQPLRILRRKVASAEPARPFRFSVAL